jgi:phospholipase C
MSYHPMLCGFTALFALSAVSALAEDRDDGRHVHTATPIKHLVVIFQENVSFDHYFGTYPMAQNNSGETPFHASSHTPKSINTLLTPLDVNNHFVPLVGFDLINKNPNGPLGSGAIINGADASNPFRLGPSQALTSDRNVELRAAFCAERQCLDHDVRAIHPWLAQSHRGSDRRT